VAAASRGRVPRRTLDTARKDLADVDDSVQKAGAAMKADDYLAARMSLQGVREKIESALRSLEPAAVQSSRRTR
jgi:hypothetical protein